MSYVIIPALITFLHHLFTVAWIGGMISLGLVTLPALKAELGQGPQRQQVVQAIFRRLQIVAKVSIVGLIATGLLLARRASVWQGLFSTGNTYSAVLAAKHMLVVAMIGIAAASAALLSAKTAPTPRREKLLAGLLLANILLGVVVLALSGLGAVLDNACVIPR